MKFTHKTMLLSAAIATVMAAGIAPVSADETGLNNTANRNLTIFFTRHAEKQTITTAVGTADTYTSEYNEDGEVDFPFIDNETEDSGVKLDEICGDGKCAEELSKQGELRAMLLADWFAGRRITDRLGAVYATHKLRTQQTVMPTATAAGLDVTILNPTFSELNPASTTPSECATLEAIVAERASGENNTILIAGHSGTLYDIMGSGVKDCLGMELTGLGLDTGNTVAGTGDADFFPKDEDGKVRDFGDVWKVVIKRNGNINIRYRLNLQQPQYLQTANRAIGR